MVARDLFTLGLDVQKVTKGAGLLTLENVHIRKRLSGDLWEIRAPLLEKGDFGATATSVDATTFRADGDAFVFAASTVRLEEEGETLRLFVSDMRGVGSGDNYRLSIDAPLAIWSSVSDEGVFPETVRLTGDGFRLEGLRGVVQRNGVCDLSGGVVVQWDFDPE